MSSKHSVTVPRCKTCNGKFYAKCKNEYRTNSKIPCSNCGAVVHYDCAVYENDDSFHMLCLDCYKNDRIEKALLKDDIIVKVEGDDLCRVYIGKNFLIDKEEKKINIDDCEEMEIEYENLDPEPFESSDFVKYSDDFSKYFINPNIEEDEFGGCKYCGWRCEYPESHIRYGNWRCKYITDRFYLDLDEDGEITSKVKCAVGYCKEDLYKRGCLKDWNNGKLWVCQECKK